MFPSHPTIGPHTFLHNLPFCTSIYHRANTYIFNPRNNTHFTQTVQHQLHYSLCLSMKTLGWTHTTPFPDGEVRNDIFDGNATVYTVWYNSAGKVHNCTQMPAQPGTKDTTHAPYVFIKIDAAATATDKAPINGETCQDWYNCRGCSAAEEMEEDGITESTDVSRHRRQQHNNGEHMHW